MPFRVDICAEELNNSVKATVALQADIKPFVDRLFEEMDVDAVIASEGANTIDIERAVLLNESGNFILDWEFVNEKTYNWADVNRDLLMIPGVIETGLFVNMATKAYLSMSDGQVRTRERDASI
ncbi:ribose-5-phosphate isomerase-like [Glossina fuscipes]|uniref:Ribose-5-phosphate isomerase-like n=1 Tax=Glossina fuscipes TaxID=7396 RepID=A0A9C6DY58_9MUSC|nr:ribose-5-phosphate isomerase-like [Glossina fuscipes]